MSAALKSDCGGWGFLVCRCGGDVCACDLDGMECPGCKECDAVAREMASEDECQCERCISWEDV